MTDGTAASTADDENATVGKTPAPKIPSVPTATVGGPTPAETLAGSTRTEETPKKGGKTVDLGLRPEEKKKTPKKVADPAEEKPGKAPKRGGKDAVVPGIPTEPAPGEATPGETIPTGTIPTEDGLKEDAAVGVAGEQARLQKDDGQSGTEDGAPAPGMRIDPETGQPRLYLKADADGRAMVWDDRTDEWRSAEDFGRDAGGRDSGGDARYLRERGLGVGYGNTAEEKKMFKHMDPNHLDRAQDASIRGMTAAIEGLPGMATGAVKGMFDLTTAMLSGKPVSAAARAFAIGVSGAKSVSDSIADTAHRFNVSDPNDPRLEKTLYGAHRKAEIDGFNDAMEVASGVLQGRDVNTLSDGDLYGMVDAMKKEKERLEAVAFDAGTPDELRRVAAARNLSDMYKSVLNTVKGRRAGVTEEKKRRDTLQRNDFEDYLDTLHGLSPSLADVVRRTSKDNAGWMRDMREYTVIDGRQIPLMNSQSAQNSLVKSLLSERTNVPPNELAAYDEYVDGCKSVLYRWNRISEIKKEDEYKRNRARHNPAVALMGVDADGNLKHNIDYSTHPTTLQKKIVEVKRLLSDPSYTGEDRQSLGNLAMQLTTLSSLQMALRINRKEAMSSAAVKDRATAMSKLVKDRGFLDNLSLLTDRPQAIVGDLASGDVARMRRGSRAVCELIQRNVGGVEVFAGSADEPFTGSNSMTRGTSGTVTAENRAAYELSLQLSNIASENGRYAMDVSDANRKRLDSLPLRFSGVREAKFGNTNLVYTDKGDPTLCIEMSRYHTATARRLEENLIAARGERSPPQNLEKMEAQLRGEKARAVLYDRLGACDGRIELLKSHQGLMKDVGYMQNTGELGGWRRYLTEQVYWKDKSDKSGFAADPSEWVKYPPNHVIFKGYIDVTDPNDTDGMIADWYLPKDRNKARRYMKAISELGKSMGGPSAYNGGTP